MVTVTRILTFLTAIAVLAVVAPSPAPASAAGAPVALTAGPTYAHTGTGDFTLTVWGYNIAPTTVIKWNGNELPTTFHDETEVSATIDAARVAAPTVAQVTLETPGEGASAASISFPVTDGVYVTPSTTSVGTGAFATNVTMPFLITGSGFGAATTLEVDTVPTPIRVLSESLLVTEPITTRATPGTMAFVFRNGVASSTRNVTIAEPSGTAIDITALSANPVKAGSPGFWMGIYGAGTWQGGATVEINAVAVPTMHRDSNNLMAYISSTLVANPATLKVTVRTSTNEVSPEFDMVVNANGPASAPTLQGSHVAIRSFNAARQETFFSSNKSPHAYVTWNGTPLRTLATGDGFVSVSIPAGIMAVPGAHQLQLINPGGLHATSAPIEFVIYHPADINCDQSVDGIDVLRALRIAAGFQEPPIDGCFFSNLAGPSGIDLNDALFIRRVAANLN